MQFQESDLSFQFGPKWMIRKYDKHRFYSRLSGVGLKAVDFITIFDNDQLILWEVKNFSRRKPALAHDPLREIIDKQSEFALAMSQKVKDTFTALDAIQEYYRRKWSFRWRQWSMSYMQRVQPDWYFWFRAHQLAATPEHCRFILLIESDEAQRIPDIRPLILSELKQMVHQVDIMNVQTANSISDVMVAFIP